MKTVLPLLSLHWKQPNIQNDLVNSDILPIPYLWIYPLVPDTNAALIYIQMFQEHLLDMDNNIPGQKIS